MRVTVATSAALNLTLQQGDFTVFSFQVSTKSKTRRFFV